MNVVNKVFPEYFLLYHNNIIEKSRSIIADLVEEDIRRLMVRNRGKILNQNDINDIYNFYIADYVELLRYMEDVVNTNYGQNILNLNKSFFTVR